MPAITSANVANAIVKLVAADALPALVGNLVMGNLVNRDYEPTLAQAGDTVNVVIPPTLGDPAVTSAVAGNGSDRRVRRVGELRDAGDDELPTEHARPAVHG